MKPWRTHYRWCLILASLAAAGMVVIGWSQLSGPRLAHEQYVRIRRGMTPTEVAVVLGGPPNADAASWSDGDRTGWQADLDPAISDAELLESSRVLLKLDTELSSGRQKVEAWSNGSVHVLVASRDGKVFWKSRQVYQSWWKKWLDRLRGRLGL